MIIRTLLAVDSVLPPAENPGTTHYTAWEGGGGPASATRSSHKEAGLWGPVRLTGEQNSGRANGKQAAPTPRREGGSGVQTERARFRAEIGRTDEMPGRSAGQHQSQQHGPYCSIICTPRNAFFLVTHNTHTARFS